MLPIKETFQTTELRYQPKTNLDPDAAVDQRRMAFIVGCVAFGLPTATILVGWLLKTCFYDSISHFYYSQFWGSVFIGSLIFIGAFLLAWQGNSDGERRLATFAAPFAAGIALFPTSLPGCTEAAWEGRVLVDITYQNDILKLVVPQNTNDYFEMTSWSSAAHGISAAILFGVLSFFAFSVFTRIVPTRDLIDPTGSTTDPANIKPEKLRRNRIYKRCGWIMMVAVAALGLRLGYAHFFGDPAWWNAYNFTLIFEAIALYAFGYSWMVKGRFWDKAYVDSTPLA